MFIQEEPLYPTTGIVSRRAPVVESKGPVFELKLNITDSEVRCRLKVKLRFKTLSVKIESSSQIRKIVDQRFLPFFNVKAFHTSFWLNGHEI